MITAVKNRDILLESVTQFKVFTRIISKQIDVFKSCNFMSHGDTKNQMTSLTHFMHYVV